MIWQYKAFRCLTPGCAGFLLWSVVYGGAPEKQRVLLLADEWSPMSVLQKSLGGDSRYLIDTASQESMPGSIDQYRFVFMYVHRPLNAVTENTLIRYTQEGGTVVALHHGLASAKMNNTRWLALMGVELRPRDDTEYPWKVLSDTTHIMVNLYPGHYITTHGIQYRQVVHFHSDYPGAPIGTFPAFELPHTEVFVNQRFTVGSERTILFGVATRWGDLMQPTSGWYKKVGKGWLFYYQAGHRPEDFADPNFSQVLRNTLQWVAN